MNPAQHILVAVLRLYRATVSPVLAALAGPGGCRFHPTCSAYALEAVRTHGACRGAWLALRRVARCHPWSEGGDDPVPVTLHPGRGEHPAIPVPLRPPAR